MQRFALREGWTTFWLVALVVFTATWSIQFADWADGLGVLTLVTLAGLVVGLVLSETRRIPSFLAHLLSLAIGAAVVLFQMTNYLSDNLGGRRAKLDYLWMRWHQWFDAVSSGQRAEDLYLFILLMAALLWLTSYLSVWFVFRVRWVWLTLLLPGVIVLMNLGYSQRVPTWLVVVYLFAAMLLLLRFSFVERELRWRRAGIPYAETIAWRGLWVGSYLAVLVIVVGWVVPLSVESQQALDAWNRVNGPWRQVETAFNTWFSSLRGPGGTGVGGFASFGDRFQLGGPLRLSDTPVVLLKGDSAQYLVAHRYDVFTGSGWESDVDETFQPQPGPTTSRLSPLVRFGANDNFPVPSDARAERTKTTLTLQVLQPRGAVLLSTGTALSVSVPTQVQVAWHDYRNVQVDLKSVKQDSVPPDLWPLIQQLRAADFTRQPSTLPTPAPRASGTPATGAPTPTPTPAPVGRCVVLDDPATMTGEQQATVDAIASQQSQLRALGIRTRFDVDERSCKATTLTFSGQFPYFGDVEAVFARDGVREGQQYEVTSLVSEATPDQLRAAGTDYPEEITRRYLQLPAYSQRTAGLAHQLADGKDNPYDIASAIETYLRTNLKYDENIPSPPANVDVVDYFLFQSKRGYCTYYASAMAEMLRILGIPSRVAVGFFPADYDSAAGGYLYRDRNAHAWVEVYFPKYGWIPFEPTAARPAIARSTPEATPVASGSPSSLPGAVGGIRDQREEPSFEGGGAGTAQPVQRKTGPAGWAVRIGVLTVLALSGILALLWLRGLRGMSPATQLFTKVQRGASWGGIRARPSMTPYEFANQIGAEVPAARPHVRLLADLYVRERYGRQPIAPNDLNRAHRAWLRLRGLLLRYLLLDRWRGAGRRGARREG